MCGFLEACELGWDRVVDEICLSGETVPLDEGLFIAADAGRTGVVRVLLPRCSGDEAATAFGLACRSRRWETARIILESHKDIVPTERNVTPLPRRGAEELLRIVVRRLRRAPAWFAYQALHAAGPRSLQIILDAFPDEANRVFSGWSLLAIAASTGCGWAVRRLLATDGVRLDTPTARIGYTPLQIAAVRGHWKVAEMLACAGAGGLDWPCFLSHDDEDFARVLRNYRHAMNDIVGLLEHASAHNMAETLRWALERTAPTRHALERAAGARAHDCVRLLLADKRTPDPDVDPLMTMPGAPHDRMILKAVYAHTLAKAKAQARTGTHTKANARRIHRRVVEYVVERASMDMVRALSEWLC